MRVTSSSVKTRWHTTNIFRSQTQNNMLECHTTAIGIEKVEFGDDLERMKQNFKQLSREEKERIFELIYTLRDMYGTEPL